MFALIHDNKVIQIEDSTFQVAEELEWVGCDSSVKVGYFYLNNTFKDSDLTEAEKVIKLRDEKKTALKKLREENTAKPTPKDSSYSINVGGVDTTFGLKSSELPMLNSIISYLTRNSKQTRPWTDVMGTRRNLSLANFQSLHDHLLVRDEIEYSLYAKRLAKLKTLTDPKAIESFDIDEIFEV
jgi:hypothetical protein